MEKSAQKFYSDLIIKNRDWIKSLKTPYINVRTPITVECQEGHCCEISSVRKLLKTPDENNFLKKCPICVANKENEDFKKANLSCKNCGKALTIEQFQKKQIFCSLACSATFNNLSRSTNDSFSRFMSLPDSKLVQLVNESKNFKNFCEMNNFSNLSKNITEKFKDRIFNLSGTTSPWAKIKKETNIERLSINSIEKGAIGEYECILQCLRRNIHVSKPVVDSYPYDLILEKNGKMYRFQIKTTEVFENGVYNFTTARNRHVSGATEVEKYDSSEFDFYYLYSVFDRKSFILPLNELISSHRQTYIRANDPKDYHSDGGKNVIYGKDILAENILDDIFKDE